MTNATKVRELGERLGKARSDLMLRMYLDEGYTMSQIGDHFGISRQRVHQIIGTQGEDAHYGIRMQQERKERLLQAYERMKDGSTAQAEADRLGITRGSFYVGLNRLGIRLAPESPEHGTLYRYRKGCHCEECRAANAAAKRQRYARGPNVHGTASAYQNYGCRCPECKRAARQARRERRRGLTHDAD